MSLAKMECKNPCRFDLETLQDIGDNIEILVIPYQAVIALEVARRMSLGRAISIRKLQP